MSVRFNNQEKRIIKRANEAIADPNTSDWHRRRFEGDLKRTEEQARKRAEKRERDKRNIPPLGVSAQKHAADCERAKEFIAKVRAASDDPERRQTSIVTRKPDNGAVTAKQVLQEPSVAESVTEAFVICPLCLVSTEYCEHSGKQKMNVQAVIDAHDRADRLPKAGETQILRFDGDQIFGRVVRGKMNDRDWYFARVIPREATYDGRESVDGEDILAVKRQLRDVDPTVRFA